MKSGIGMALLKLLLNSSLIFLVAASVITDETSKDIFDNQTIYRLPQHVTPLSYEVNIIPNIEEGMFYGEANITIFLLCNTTQNISFYAEHLYIYDSILISILTREKLKDVYIPSRHLCDNISLICTLYFDNEIPSGPYVLKLNYTGVIYKRVNSDGVFKTVYINREEQNKIRWMFGAGDFQKTDGAQRIFPCWDELTSKATFTISIKHPKRYTALSNMPVEKSEEVEANMMWTHFQTTPAMPNYLVAIVLSDLIPFFNNNTDIKIWCRDRQTTSQLSFAYFIAVTTTTYLEKRYFQDINGLKKIPKTDHIAIPGPRSEGLTNWGIIFYSEAAIACDVESNSFRRMEVVSLVARKVVHQWFSNVVRPSSWSHMWLNEGIAMFLGLHVFDKMFPEYRLMDLFVVQIRHESLHLESNVNMPPLALKIDEPFNIKSFSSFHYIKAAAILRMLYHILTEEVFQRGIHNYLNKHMLEASASPDDLWAAMQTALNKSHHKYKINVKDIMDTWITQSHYPVLRVTRNYTSGYTVIRPEIRHASGRNEWRILLTYVTKADLDFNLTWIPYVQQSTQEFFLYLPSDYQRNDWIIINLQQIGYYRVMYDRENWRRIAKYLNSDEYTKIHVLNRAQIIDDAYHFLIAKQLDFDMFNELITYLSQETDYVAWYPMFKIFGYMRNVFSHPEATFIKVHMRSIVYGLLTKIGYDDKPNEDMLIKSLRQEAAEWACILGDKMCIELAYHKLQDYLANSTTHMISPRRKKWIYCGGLMIENATTWDKVFHLVSKNLDSEILESLTCIERFDVICDYLQIINSNGTISRNYYKNVFLSAIAMHANSDKMLEFIFGKFEKVRPRNLTFLEIMKAIIKYMYTETQFEMIMEFVKDNAKDLISDVQSEIERHMSEMNHMLDCFSSSRA